MSIVYQEIDSAIEKQIENTWGSWVTEYGCIHHGDGCCSLAAMSDGKPVGFISTFPLQLPPPLQMHCEAYIDDIEVLEAFRKRGIARELLSMTERWARAYGYRQIRAWSSDDKEEAISMWYSLGYGICPAVMRGESVIKEFVGKPIYGFYVSKVL